MKLFSKLSSVGGIFGKISGALGVAALALTLCSGAWAAGAPQVKFDTDQGSFIVEVYPDKAPRTAANFLEYVKTDQYAGTIFHRVINGFMIQGGGFSPLMVEKPTRGPIPLESNNGLKNLAGTIAMARTDDPNSARAQFFINVIDNPFLDFADRNPGYAVFGKVISGMDVVDRIEAVPTTSHGYFSNVPATSIIIKSATLLSN
ncbi:MAG: peptidylprolyl isomerase [Candidatus Protistobacter heckmanni]|nr:peptidylprolyl isomerase [Candidatus Protistobacter heckmanni]